MVESQIKIEIMVAADFGDCAPGVLYSLYRGFELVTPREVVSEVDSKVLDGTHDFL